MKALKVSGTGVMLGIFLLIFCIRGNSAGFPLWKKVVAGMLAGGINSYSKQCSTDLR